MRSRVKPLNSSATVRAIAALARSTVRCTCVTRSISVPLCLGRSVMTACRMVVRSDSSLTRMIWSASTYPSRVYLARAVLTSTLCSCHA